MKRKWYYSSWFIVVLCMLWFAYGIPLVVAILLLWRRSCQEKDFLAELEAKASDAEAAANEAKAKLLKNEDECAELKSQLDEANRKIRGLEARSRGLGDALTSKVTISVGNSENHESSKKKAAVTFLPSEYVVFDLETTGLNPQTCEILEIGALKIKNGEIVDKFETFVRPEGQLSADAMKVNHITYDMVKNADSAPECIAAFRNFVGNLALVGYNSSTYDFPIIRRVAKDTGFDFYNRSIDLLPIARKALSLSSYKLVSVADHYRIDTGTSHRAIDDCQTTFECCKRLVTESDCLQESLSAGISEDEIVIVSGKNFCLTGDFRDGMRDEVGRKITNAGGTVKDNVSSRTDYVVIGELGSQLWSHGNYGSKIKKAMDVQAAGGKVKIVTEQQLMAALQ